MTANAVGRLAMRYLPQQIASIEVDRRKDSVWRLQDRQSLHRESSRITAGRGGRWRCGCGSCRRRRRCGLRCGFGLRDGSRRVSRAAVTRPEHFDKRLPGNPSNISDVRKSLGWRHERVRVDSGVRRGRICDVRLRIYPPPGQLVPPPRLPIAREPSSPLLLPRIGGLNSGPGL